MINYKSNSSYDNVFHQANKFMNLIEEYNIDNIDFFDLNVLYINMLLASELYLKCLLMVYNVDNAIIRKCGHDLLKLYNLLPSCDQKNIEERFHIFHGGNIINFLNKIKKDFVDCRYMFVEGKETTRKLYFQGVKAVMYELNYITSIKLYGTDTYEELR